MDQFQIGAIIILAVFYTAYFSKMLLQKGRGIRTQQIGRGEKEGRTLMIERIMGAATAIIVAAELYSILFNAYWITYAGFRYAGISVAAVGVLVFICSMATMRDSWRAGITNENTKLVTGGIYRFSRNPAFLGFDLMYIGILLAFANLLHLLLVAFAIIMLHLQVLEEEKHLIKTFGFDYQRYMTDTKRYFLFV